MRLSVANGQTVDGITTPVGTFTPPVQNIEFDARGAGQKFLVFSADTAAVTDGGVIDFGDPTDPAWADTPMTAPQRNYMNSTYGATFVNGDTFGMAYTFFMRTRNHMLFMSDGTPFYPAKPKPEVGS